MAACSNIAVQSQVTPTNVDTQEQIQTTDTPSYTMAEVVFDVQVPEQTPSTSSIYLDIIDDITGISTNPTRYQMEAGDDLHFTVSVPVRLGSIIKYRYTRDENSSAIEYTPHNQEVFYRMVEVQGPESVSDIVSSWSDMTFEGNTGRIIGTVTDQDSGEVIPGMLILAGGYQTVSAADGSFDIEGIMPGTHNIVTYAVDGSYQMFQQGAAIAENATTPVEISLAPVQMVNVTFNVSIPSENVVGMPVRIAGNLTQTGNTFGVLSGGSNSVASQLPAMSMNQDGTYSSTLQLPVGSDFRYKYTLGDGFWNAELTKDGDFNTRQIIVGNEDTTIDDTVTTWRASGANSVTFTVQAPEDTPTGDTVSLQFFTTVWTEPIPMWSVGNNQWVYVLYNPMHKLDKVNYRYCRNDQCGSADNSATTSDDQYTGQFSQSDAEQSFTDTITSWAWYSVSETPTTVNATDITSRGNNFIAGIEYQPNYDPTWQSRYYTSAQNVKSIGSNWLFLTPGWTFTNNNPVVLESQNGTNQSWADTITTLTQSSSTGLSIAIFPTPIFSTSADEWWQAGTRDTEWWSTFYSRYEEFLLNYAQMAATSNAQALVLGGDWLTPALPNGVLSDGTAANVPSDVVTRWESIIANVRSVYSGTILWAVTYPENVTTPPSFLSQVDGIYVLMSTSLTDQLSPSETDLETNLGTILDNNLKPFEEAFQKPLYLGLSYASADGGAQGCVPLNSGTCLDSNELSQPADNVPASVSVDLQEQVDIYNAFFAQINQRDWISGIISRGYYPPAALQDYSPSINGKPAQDVIWYWFPRLTGQSTQ